MYREDVVYEHSSEVKTLHLLCNQCVVLLHAVLPTLAVFSLL